RPARPRTALPGRPPRPQHRPRPHTRRRRGNPHTRRRGSQPPSPPALSPAGPVAQRLPDRTHRWPTAARRPDLLRRTHRTVQVCPLPNGRTGALRPPPRPPRARQHRHAPVGVADRGPSETAARSAVSAKTTCVHSAHHGDAARLEIARRRVVKRCRPRPRRGSTLVGSAQVIAVATELSGSLGLASFV